MFQVGDNTELVYSVKVRIFGVITVKYNLGFATNGEFLVIYNIKTGVYIILDHNTNFSIHGKTRITFLTASNNVDYDKFITQTGDILKVCTPITVDTKDSFDFLLIINAFYSRKNFKIDSIYSSKTLATVLRKNFGEWFALIETHIKAGNIFITCSYWGFLAVIIDLDIQVSLIVLDILKVYTTRYYAMETHLIVYLTNIVTTNFAAYKNAAGKLTALHAILGDVDVETLIDYLDDTQYDAAVYQITVRNTLYAIAVYRVKYSYAIRLTIMINNIHVHYWIHYISGLLSILNAQTNMEVSLQETSVLMHNKTSASVFVIDFSNKFNTSVTVCNNATLTALARDGKQFDVHEQIRAYIKNNSLSGNRCNLQTLMDAVKYQDVKRVGDVVGSADLSVEFITSFRAFLGTAKVGDIGELISTLVVNIFGMHPNLNLVVKTVVECLTNIISKGTGLSHSQRLLLS